MSSLGSQNLNRLLKDIRACTICAESLPHTPRPVLRAHRSAVICIAGQAPGTRVHKTGVPFNDPSGDRLRDWMGVDRETFYDEKRIAIVPMGFCFPGLDEKGGDLPPRKECPPQWRAAVFEQLPNVQLTILVGGYAQKWHLRADAKKSLTATVEAWRDYRPKYIPTPHPSWRNNHWLKKNSWFEDQVLPYLRRRVRQLLRE